MAGLYSKAIECVASILLTEPSITRRCRRSALNDNKKSRVSLEQKCQGPPHRPQVHTAKSELQNMDSKNRNQIPVYAVPMQEAAGRSQHTTLCRSPASVNMHMSARSRPRSLRMDIPLLASG